MVRAGLRHLAIVQWLVIGDGRWSQLNSRHLSHKNQSLWILKPIMWSQISSKLSLSLSLCLYTIPTFFFSFFLRPGTFGIQCTFDLSSTFIDILYVPNLEMREWEKQCSLLVGFRLCFELFWLGVDIVPFHWHPIDLSLLANWNSVHPFGI